MRVLHIGDIVGKPGRQVVTRSMRGLRQREGLDLVIANAENAAGGSGLTPEIYRELIKGGVDCITLGDHIYRRAEIFGVLEREINIVKPANYPPDAPGKEFALVPLPGGGQAAVVSLMGRVFMKQVDCYFIAIDRVLAAIPPEVKCIFVDFHAEATSDKQLLGRYLDGKVTSVLGTHTHVTTADEQIFPHGTAFQCDIGMTGPHLSVLGRRIDRVLETTRTQRPTNFEVAAGDVRLSGTIVDFDPTSGKATAIRRLSLTMDDAELLHRDFYEK